jgi:hypothetical protein
METKMTYLQLLKALLSLDPSKLRQTATIYVADTEEYYPITGVDTTTEDDVLDADHAFLYCGLHDKIMLDKP